MAEYVIEMLDITKIFPSIVANDCISLRLKKGEIHALLGENGAGKSTLMSILFGMYEPDEGVIKKDGQEIKINSPNEANKYKIGMVHQHFKLINVFTVLENIVLGAETTQKGFLKMESSRKKIQTLAEKHGLQVDIDAKVEDITVGMQQRVEILKMLYRDNDILIFDEPTAVLTPQEISELMSTMKSFAKEGKSILFITHKLNEIKEVADRCTVLRKGQYIGTVDVKTTSKEELSELMVGRKVNLEIPKKDRLIGRKILEVENLVVQNKETKINVVDSVSFSVSEGEVVAIAGIDGNGQSELIYALSGLVGTKDGTITYNGEEINKRTVRERSEIGISHIPEDRHKYGLVLDYNLAYNIVLKDFYKKPYQQNGFLVQDTILDQAEKLIETYDVRSALGPFTTVRSMSGGNQQKVIIAREMDSNPDLLIAVQPTRGLDVGAIEFIHKKIIEQRDNGKAILLVSLELDEVMSVSDRILVIYEGKIVANVKTKDITVQELGLYMSGSKKMDVI